MPYVKHVTHVRQKRPLTIDAWVLLPDHLHCIWTLPETDADFSTRWALIKRKVSLICGQHYKRQKWISPSKQKHRESTYAWAQTTCPPYGTAWLCRSSGKKSMDSHARGNQRTSKSGVRSRPDPYPDNCRQSGQDN